jgi:hypothetical protein
LGSAPKEKELAPEFREAADPPIARRFPYVTHETKRDTSQELTPATWAYCRQIYRQSKPVMMAEWNGSGAYLRHGQRVLPALGDSRLAVEARRKLANVARQQERRRFLSLEN